MVRREASRKADEEPSFLGGALQPRGAEATRLLSVVEAQSEILGESRGADLALGARHVVGKAEDAERPLRRVEDGARGAAVLVARLPDGAGVQRDGTESPVRRARKPLLALLEEEGLDLVSAGLGVAEQQG